MSPAATILRPIVAIVGRPNVGKSTLFNRLVGRRRSLVRDVPGVTRDRLYGPVSFERWQATAVDTGGFDPGSEEPLVAGVRRQILMALDEADVIVFVIDARAGVTGLDTEIARILRRADRPVVVAANKVDGVAQDAMVGEVYRLGFGQPVPVSAEHGRGVAELLEVIRERAPQTVGRVGPHGEATHLAVIGRPNVGKSSLVNAMVGDERVLVHEEPGTTRDAVDTPIVYDGKPYVLVDTAGIRRKGRVTEALEKLAVVMALKGLERSQVAILVLDAFEGVTAQDAHIAGYANEAGRAIVIAVNKWDLVSSDHETRSQAIATLREQLVFVDYAPICFTAATRGEGLEGLFAAVERVAQQARRRVPPADATRVLRDAIARRPLSVNGVSLLIHSVSQVGVAPPTFAVRVNIPDELHFSHQRYLTNSLRRAFGFEGSPIRLALRRAPGPKRPVRRRTRR